MNTILLCLIVGIIVFLITFLYFSKKKETIRKYNTSLQEEENKIQLHIKDLENEYLDKKAQLEKEYFEKNNEHLILQAEVSNLQNQIEEKKASITSLEEQAKTATNSLEATLYDLMSTELAQKASIEIDHYKHIDQEAQKEYEIMMKELMEEYISKRDELMENYEKVAAKLNDAKSKAIAAIEANKRAALDKQQKDFYRLQLDDIDKEEIQRIRSIEPYLRKREPLNKVIWKVYYEKPCTDLIGRVVGHGRKTGIYKITNIENGMCYIGQAVDIAERWKQHIKRGIGADPPTQNKLYPAMLAIGVENFMFEIIEECANNILNEREDYWQDFYNAKEWGYSIK